MQPKVFAAVAFAAIGGIVSFGEMPAIAFPPAVEQVLAQAQGQTYREPSGLFEISFPAGYTYEQTGSGIAFTSTDEKFGGSVDYGSAQGNVIGLEQLEASLKSEYEQRLSDLVWQGSSPQPDGSLRIDWTGRDAQGNALDAVSFVEQRGDTIFILNLFGVNAPYQDYNADAEVIVGSYRVKQASANANSLSQLLPASGLLTTAPASSDRPTTQTN